MNVTERKIIQHLEYLISKTGFDIDGTSRDIEHIAARSAFSNLWRDYDEECTTTYLALILNKTHSSIINYRKNHSYIGQNNRFGKSYQKWWDLVFITHPMSITESKIQSRMLIGYL